MEIDKISSYLERLGFKDPNLVKSYSGESNILYMFDINGKKIIVKTENPVIRNNNLRREYDVLVALSNMKPNIAPFPHNYNEGVLGRSMEIIEYFEGQTFSLDYSDRLSEVASLIKEIHRLENVPVTNPGRYRSDLDFLSEIMQYVNMRMEEISNLEIPKNLVKTLKEVVRRSYIRIENKRKYFLGNNLKFCHKDFKPDNLIVPPHGEIKIIDWEYADICDPAFDLSLFVNGIGISPKSKIAFIDSYEIETDETIKQRIDTYTEYGRIPSLIWCFDRLYNPKYKIMRKDKVGKYLEKAKRNIEDIVKQGILKEWESHNFNSVFEDR